MGDIEVTINNGTITNVFGGNDLKGKPNGNITVTLMMELLLILMVEVMKHLLIQQMFT